MSKLNSCQDAKKFVALKLLHMEILLIYSIWNVYEIIGHMHHFGSEQVIALFLNLPLIVLYPFHVEEVMLRTI